MRATTLTATGIPPLTRRVLPYLFWSVLAFTVLFWRLGATSFWDPDEAHYAETTRELLTGGDWLTPYYNGQPFFDKPVLFHALQAIPMWLLGPTETAARLVTALAALALVGVTWWMGSVLISRRAGFVAALLLTVNPAVFALARYAIIDAVFAAFLVAGVALLTVAALADRPRLQWAGYAFIALATLAKGPIAAILCGLAVLAALAASRDARQRLLRLRWMPGIGIVLALSAPWFVLMIYRHGRTFVDVYFAQENVLLFTRSVYERQPPWWFYLRDVLPAALFPWTALALGRLYDDVRAVWRDRRLDTFECLLWIWTACIVGFFSVSAFKLDHYVFPAAPALCLLCGRAWCDREDAGGTASRGARFGAWMIGPLLIVAGLVAGGLMLARLTLPPPALVVPAALVVMGIASVVVERRGTTPRAPWIASAAMGLLYAGALIWVVPAFEERKVVPDLARWVAAQAEGRDRVATYVLNRWNPAFRFYVDRQVTFLQERDKALEFLDTPGRAYLVMRQEAFTELQAAGAHLQLVYARDGMWVTSGRALWRERSEPARFVVATHDEPPHER